MNWPTEAVDPSNASGIGPRIPVGAIRSGCESSPGAAEFLFRQLCPELFDLGIVRQGRIQLQGNFQLILGRCGAPAAANTIAACNRTSGSSVFVLTTCSMTLAALALSPSR